MQDAMKLTSPVFTTIFVIGNNVSARYKLCQIDHAVERRVHHQARNKTVSCAVSEWDEHYGYEGWNGVADVSPVDGGNLSHHQATDLYLR